MIRRTTLVACTEFVLAGGLAHGAPKASDSVVKASVNAGKPGQDGKQTVEVTLAIDKGYHLYANPNEAFPDSEVVVTASAAGKAMDVKVDYPKGTLVPASPPDIKAHHVYEGTVTIKVVVDRNKAGSKPIDLNVQVHACNANACLLPADIKLTVP